RGRRAQRGQPRRPDVPPRGDLRGRRSGRAAHRRARRRRARSQSRRGGGDGALAGRLRGGAAYGPRGRGGRGRDPARAGVLVRARVRELVAGARASIEANRRRIDDLNVYPVPDGDTGTNLTLTVRAVEEALALDGPDDRAALAHEISRAALMGARGNSGVILSQIVRGACDALAETDDLAEVLRSASDAAYRAVKKPVEGTMLTAIAAMADAAEHGGDFAAVLARGDDTVARTREMLPVLRDAGVVDAGAAGLVEIVRGIQFALTGEALPPPALHEPELSLDAVHHDLSRYRYCTVFVVEGDSLDADELESELERLGDSLLVVGDSTALKVHVHTDDPGRALSLGVARGAVAGVEIANMH